MLKLCLLLLVAAQAQMSSVGTIDATVSKQTDLTFTLQSSETLKSGDCVHIHIQNPYTEDLSQYASFSQTGPLPSCTIDNQVNVECQALAEDLLQIKLTKESTSTLLQGRTNGNVFTNPFSTRRITQVSVTHFRACDMSSQPLVVGSARLTSFLPSLLPTQSVTLTSSSRKIGVTDATLTVQFQSELGLRQKGRLLIKSPAWYQKEALGQEGVSQDFYTDSMISFDSEVTLSAPLEIESYQFLQSSDTLTIRYTASRTLDPLETVTLTISNFKNPPNQSKVTGFQLSTQDFLGYLIEQSDNNLALLTDVSEPQLLNDVSIEMLGDQNGDKIGQISSLQTIQLQFSLASPLEPFCYFEMVFPETLRLDQNNLQLITGSGIFEPYYNTQAMNTGQYTLDQSTNTLVVQGCRLPDSLSSTPYGTLTISVIKLPDYVRDLEPIAVKVYADDIFTNLVVDDASSARIMASDLTPGDFIVEEFRPSNYYASATNVVYNINVRPQHGVKPESRIVIEMPPHLIFNQEQGCSVVLTICECALDASTNTLTLTDIFDKETDGGILIKLTILSATNPMGARPAGPWSIRSETLVNGEYFVVDGQEYPESFTARSGTIFSDLKVSNLQVSSSDTLYSFSLVPEHDVPKMGKLIVTFPEETNLKPGIEVLGLSDYKQQGNTLTFSFSEGGITGGTPIAIQVKGVQNVRSMAPTSRFVIETTDLQDYVIDAGGQDINVELNQFAYFEGIKIESSNTTNGATVELIITVGLAYPVWEKDTLHLTFPKQVRFSDSVTCTPGNSLALKVTCTNTETYLQITFNQVSETETGEMVILVQGILNPRTFKQSDPFTNVYTTDALGYFSQAAKDTFHLTLQTDSVALIQSFEGKQETEEYGIQGEISLTIETYNAISPTGTIVLAWPEAVQLFDNTFCKITTHKQIQRADVCQFDMKKRTLRIQNAFSEMQSLYSGSIQIYLSRVQNPTTNENLLPYTLTTYDDAALLYPLDSLTFLPKLKCHWPCHLCGTDKSYCTACWDDRLSFLFRHNRKSTCMDSCPDGWTSNGSQPAACQQCDVSCATCADAGNEGDVGRCLTCNPGYDFFQPTGSDGTGLCLQKCAQGFYDDGSGICLPCASNCGDCEGTPDRCTYCHLDGALPALLNEECVGDCPSEYVDMAGVCELCISPCASCAESPSLCTSCDGTDGLKYRFGATCVSQCPEGTKLEKAYNLCTGCVFGCDVCDIENPSVCFKCAGSLILFEQSCWTACPEGSIQTFDQSTCVWLSDLDTKLVYFPFLIVMALIAFVSWVGHKVKPKHLVLSNFVIMMSAVEHVALFLQVILTFIYGFIAIAVAAVLVWLGFLATQVYFWLLWKRQVHDADPKFIAYRSHSDHALSARVRSWMAILVSWKFQKLLYSRFFGLHVEAFHFSEPEKVQKLMLKLTITNIGATLVPLILLNSACLFLTVWGTQLYITLIENILIAAVMSVCCVIEHRQMVEQWAIQEIIKAKSSVIQKSLTKKAKARLQMKKLPTQFDKKHEERFSFLFLAAKTDELLYVFGGRHCKSDFHDSADKEQDTRQVWSWPATPRPVDDVNVDDPPKPIDQQYAQNCYFEAKKKSELRQHNGQGFNKGAQKGGPFDGDLLRADTAFLSNQSDTDMSVSEGIPRARVDSRKQRGRQNRFFKQIDAEDHVAGVNSISITRDDTQLNRSVNKKLSAIPEERLNENEETIQAQLKNQRKLAKEEAEQTDKLLTQSIHATTDKPVLNRPKKELPDAKLRNFNEIDILGKFDRDARGNVIVLTTEGQTHDKDDRRVTQQGYLLDDADDIVRADDPTFKMFTDVIGGVLPAPFSLERFNFNPFALFGNFKSFKQSNDPLSATKASDKANLLDQLFRPVNCQGFLVNADGHIVNQLKQKVFDKKQLDSRGCIQPLFNYTGQKFQITDVMGVLKLSSQNEPIKMDSVNNKGQIVYKDLSGHLINVKGYLTDSEGNIVNRQGKVIWRRCELKNGEFPKIFGFSKFNMSQLSGTFQVGPDHKPILKRSASGSLEDDNGVRVNKDGYMVDVDGNIVDKNGNVMFEKQILSADGKLPSLFKNREIFGTDSDEDINQMLNEIESPQKAKIKGVQEETQNYLDGKIQKTLDESTTKLLGNQTTNSQKNVGLSLNLLTKSRDRPIASQGMSKHRQTHFQDGSGSADSKQQLSSRKPRNRTTKNAGGVKLVKVEQMYESDIRMANAYGGEAQPRVRMIPKRFMTTQRERPFNESSLRESSYSGQMPRNYTRNQYITNQPSQRSVTQTQHQTQVAAYRNNAEQLVHRPPSPSNAAYSIKDRMQIARKRQLEREDEVSDIERELAELYEQEVDRFIDGSNFEVESLSGYSQLSKGSFASLTRNQNEMHSRTKALEAEYLRKLEEQKSKHKQMQQDHQQKTAQLKNNLR